MFSIPLVVFFDSADSSLQLTTTLAMKTKMEDLIWIKSEIKA